jgi:3-oxoacyl-[acyl-carrier protein] reductase
MMMFSLAGKTALVTGASGGIGAAVARALHSAGATVGISGTRAQVLEELKVSLGGERVHVLPCNLASAEDVEKLVPAAEAAMGGVDILVNNAGITRDGLAMRMKDEDWQAVLDVNLTSSFRLARAAMKLMMKKRWGRIVSVTSVVGVTGNPGQANYVASKAALIGLSKTLAQELASRNVTVNCVAPGFIATPMTDALNEKQKDAILGRIPAGRMGSPEEIAAAVLFLASNEAAYVTGHTLHVNGGMAMV